MLVLLEAMKMELAVKAPHDGTVARIACEAGAMVQPGIPLVELAPIAETGSSFGPSRRSVAPSGQTSRLVFRAAW